MFLGSSGGGFRRPCARRNDSGIRGISSQGKVTPAWARRHSRCGLRLHCRMSAPVFRGIVTVRLPQSTDTLRGMRRTTGTAPSSQSNRRRMHEVRRAAMNIWHNRWALGRALLILGAGPLQGCSYPTNGYPGYPAYAGYGYPAYGNYGYPAYGDYGGGVVIGGGLNGGYDHGHD